MLERGELSTTQSVLTQIMRLQQICCGFLQPDEGDIQEIKNTRLDELLNVLDETQGKVIIWATWSYDIRRIEEALRKRYGNDSVASYYGETDQDDRQDIVERFQDFLQFKVLCRAAPNRRLWHYAHRGQHRCLFQQQLRFRN